MRDITDLMNTYRECSRNLWNVYFSRKKDIGASLNAFGQLRQQLFESLVLSELDCETVQETADTTRPALKVVPERRSLILIKRLSEPGEAGYWDEVKDMMVGSSEITLAFVDYFDFFQVPVKEFRYCLCKILKFPSHVAYEGREALVEAISVKVFHDESTG